MAAKRDAGKGAFIVIDRKVDRKSIYSRVGYCAEDVALRTNAACNFTKGQM